MPCSPGMAACHRLCGHRSKVRDYRAERSRQLEVAERVTANYATEYAEYVEAHPIVTFKQWLLQTRRAA